MGGPTSLVGSAGSGGCCGGSDKADGSQPCCRSWFAAWWVACTEGGAAAGCVRPCCKVSLSWGGCARKVGIVPAQDAQ